MASLCDKVRPSRIRYLGPMKCFYSVATFRLLAAAAFACVLLAPVSAQKRDSAPVVVQPGAPGKPTRTLPPSTRPKLPPYTAADVQFMQHMIMHHAQAVEMTALIDSHTDNKEIRTLGTRISKSQDDEIKFMKRWLTLRGQPSSPVSPPAHQMHGVHTTHHEMLM